MYVWERERENPVEGRQAQHLVCVSVSRCVARPVEGHPISVLGAVSPFLEPFCGDLSPRFVKKIKIEMWLRLFARAAGVERRVEAERERETFIDNLLVRIHFIVEKILVDRPCAMRA